MVREKSYRKNRSSIIKTGSDCVNSSISACRDQTVPAKYVGFYMQILNQCLLCNSDLNENPYSSVCKKNFRV